MKKLSHKTIFVIVIILAALWLIYTFFDMVFIQTCINGDALSLSARIILLRITAVFTLLCCILLLPINIRISVFSILITFFLLDTVFRIKHLYESIRYPEYHIGEAILWEYDEDLGWKKKKNASDHYMFAGKRFRNYVETNSHGLRDEEMSYNKPEGFKRILLLGDSMTVGLEVKKEEVVDSQLENLLSEHGYSNFQIVNGGTRGWGSDQLYLFLIKEGIKYQPDIVIYIFASNDPINNLTIHRPSRLFGKSYFLLNKNGELDLQGAPVPKYFENYDLWTLSDKELEDVYNYKLSKIHSIKDKLIKKKPKLNNNMGAMEILKRDIPYFITNLPSIKWINTKLAHLWAGQFSNPIDSNNMTLSRSRELTKKIILEMSKTARSIGADFLVYETTSMGEKAEPTWLKLICDEIEVSYFNSFKEFREISKGKKVLRFNHDGHWNAKGHKVVATSFYNYLKDKNWIKN